MVNSGETQVQNVPTPLCKLCIATDSQCKNTDNFAPPQFRYRVQKST